MKLEDSVEIIRNLIFKALDKRLSQLGLMPTKQNQTDMLPPELYTERKGMQDILDNLTNETGGYSQGREKLIDELSFTLFNRIAGVKVMEAAGLIPEVFTRRESQGGKSFGHNLWLERNPEKMDLKLSGLREYIRHEFNELSEGINLYSSRYLYDMLPDVFDLNGIIEEFNKIEPDVWKSDDVMGWMYEYYNRDKKKEFKASKDKVEYNWLPLTSQFYTPKWVVEFIVNNSLGKLWMEMHPESRLKERHDIANVPDAPTIESKPVKDIKVLDPAAGSGNFLLYAFDLLYEIYQEEGYEEPEIPHLIIENNLFGIDLDDRAVQIAQLGLYIKALKRNKNIRISHMNVVSTDFYLPEFHEVKDFFQELIKNKFAEELLETIWADLRMAHKFGSLIRIEERIKSAVRFLENKRQMGLFGIKKWDAWQRDALEKIKQAIQNYSRIGNGNIRFFKTKTLDSITFVEILINKFDIVVANPPYTDSADYGKELKTFVENNYKKPKGFHTNLYATFMKRASELISDKGKTGLVHPPTFMYIKTFEDMREFIINNFHINIFIEWGYLGMFSPTSRVDSAIYILENKSIKGESVFIKLNDLYETKRKQVLFEAFYNYIDGKPHNSLYLIDQEKLKIIRSFPFIYWISDEFRGKFLEKPLDDVIKICQGLATSNNHRFLRYWWEVDIDKISIDYQKDKKKWVPYAKGGPYNKWFGNLWLLVDWENDGKAIKKFERSVVRNEENYFKKGITYSGSGSKGVSFRMLPPNCIFDVGGSCLFPIKEYKNINYLIAFLNSKTSFYVSDCLNPTVNTQVGDLKRIPFIPPNDDLENRVTLLSNKNIEIKQKLCECSIIEKYYTYSPIIVFYSKNNTNDLRKSVKTYLDYENELTSQIFLNEFVIDELIFKVYQLTEKDKKIILDQQGIPIGSFPLINGYQLLNDDLQPFVKEYIKTLDVKDPLPEEKLALKKKIESLYFENHSLEEISKATQINPISIAQIIKESPVVPEKRMNEIAQDFLFDMVREVLQEDDDGIIPLVEYAGKTILQNKLYDKLIEKGLTDAQIANFKEILGRDINPYIENHFFKDLSDRLNLFMYLPKTPFIWHLSSGDFRGFEAFIIIYKWSRDKLLKLRAIYVEKRESSLKNRLIDLEGEDSIKAQGEKETIHRQLKEIGAFKAKIDEILKSGYNPNLDDGVGKNIAPLQEKGVLKAEVLKEKELEKFLNADW
ncbi:BREX-1 system adenine-specific DNA-methyltransferase PglX [bacterium]|nr:BREX-1 system adenine-specific DNA-methyltransferase PglX [bacterium]